MSPHRGVLISRNPAEGLGGLIFAVGTAAIFVLAVPAFRPLVAACVVGGILLAPVLRKLHS
jgi:hypothetical protein